jgi:hypothetical protein
MDARWGSGWDATVDMNTEQLQCSDKVIQTSHLLIQ